MALPEDQAEAHLERLALEDEDRRGGWEAPTPDDDPLAWDGTDDAYADAYLSGEDGAEAPPIFDEVQADRLLGRLRRLRAEQDRILTVATRRVADVEDWSAARLSPLRQRAAQIEELLRGWHAALLEREPRRKTIHLPCGELRARAGQPAWEIDPERVDELGAWLFERYPQLIVFPEPPAPRVDRTALKQTLVVRDDRDKVLRRGVDPKTGEVPPGLAITNAETTFSAVTDTEEPF